MSFGMDDNLANQAADTNPTDDEADRRLVARFLSGDQAAFDEIVSAHQRRIAHLVYRLLGWPTDVDDVVQDVFVSVLSNLDRFRGDSRFSTWITSIAVNTTRSHQRRRLFRRRHKRRLVDRCRQTSNNNHHESVSTEDHEKVRKAVRTLPVKFREPIVLRYFQEMSVTEIADMLGVSSGAVEVRLSRARRRLREVLGNSYGED